MDDSAAKLGCSIETKRRKKLLFTTKVLCVQCWYSKDIVVPSYSYCLHPQWTYNYIEVFERSYV